MNRTPPRLATWLLGLLLPERDKEMLIGDLVEEFALVQARVAAETADRSPGSAAEWYWRQSARSIARLGLAEARRGQWLKTLGAMIIGYLVVAMLVMAEDAAMSAVLSSAGTGAYSVISLAIGLPVMILGGYLAAWMRPRAARALAILVAIMGVISLVITADGAPFWYQVALILVGTGGALTGGEIRRRRKERSRT